MKKFYIITVLVFVVMPLVLSTVLQPDLRFTDLTLQQELKTKEFKDKLDKRYEDTLVKKDLLERDNDYSKDKAALYQRYRQKVSEGTQTLDQALEALTEKYSPGLTIRLKNYEKELNEGNAQIASKYEAQRQALKNSY